ncbi:MAG: LiaF transmembrane domain-containing protein [Bacteroidota bacterium]
MRDIKHRSNLENRPHRSYSVTSKIAIGVVLILLGFMLIIRNTGFMPNYFEDIIFSWQMLLIAIGFVMTLGTGNKTPGLIVMAVGGFFIIPEVLDIPFRTYRLFWPAILIIIGIIVLTNARLFNRESWKSESSSSNDIVDMVNIFGGGERRILSQNFQGGKISCVFGGGEIDLTGAKLAQGTHEMEIACVFGGVSLIVPPDWNIVIDVTPVLGGFSDDRKTSGSVIDMSKTLVVKGAVVFGGGEIKGY